MLANNTINGINYSKNININMSYANSVLQCLYTLSSIREYFLNQQSIVNFHNFKMPLSKSFYLLLQSLQNGFIGDSTNTIDSYQIYANGKESALKTDPYHFLFYFLEQLHWENNKPSNQFYNYSQLENTEINSRKNDNYMYNLFCSFFQSTQNSIISEKFYNIIKFKTICNQCNNTFYKYGMRKAFKFDIEDYFRFRNEAIPEKANNPKLDLDECFRCYTGGISAFCPWCQRNCATEYKKIWSASEILIIYFHRINHPFRGDVDFRSIISISNYFSTDNIKNNSNLLNTTYSLKACISFANNNKYFVDCFIPCNNNVGGIWMRYMDGEKKILGDVEMEIHEFEPQLLIYELDNFQKKNNANFMGIILKMMQQQQNFRQAMDNFNRMKASQKIQFQMMNFNPRNNNLNINCNINTVNNYNPMNQDVSNAFFFELKFICVPESGDQRETPANTIKVQTKKDDTINKAILNFFTKLAQEQNSIKYFKFNDTILDKSSQKTLEESNINSKSIIKAIKSQYFKEFINQ